MNRKFKLVHLDDHMIFSAGFQKQIDPERKIFFIQSFVDSKDALRYIRNSLDSGERIDMILTDFRHLGDDGYEFASAVRNYETAFSCCIPILLLTMYPVDYELIQKGLQDGAFSSYLSKNCNKEGLHRAIEQLLPGYSGSR